MYRKANTNTRARRTRTRCPIVIYDARALKCFIFSQSFTLSLPLPLSSCLSLALREHFTFPRANCDCACLLLPHLINLETLSHSFTYRTTDTRFPSQFSLSLSTEFSPLSGAFTFCQQQQQQLNSLARRDVA